jgi:hypothetical protein
VDARYLIAAGLLISAFALFQMTNLFLGIDYRTLMLWRIYQACGMAFLFVPVNTISFADMPPEASNQISGLMISCGTWREYRDFGGYDNGGAPPEAAPALSFT